MKFFIAWLEGRQLGNVGVIFIVWNFYIKIHHTHNEQREGADFQTARRKIRKHELLFLYSSFCFVKPQGINFVTGSSSTPNLLLHLSFDL